MAVKTYYQTDRHGVYTGVSFARDTRLGFRPEWITTPPPEIPEGSMAQWRGHAWVLITEIPESDRIRERKSKVPAEISRRQAKQQLQAMGKLADVPTAIDAIEDLEEREVVRIYWEDSQVFHRGHPTLIKLATALGMDDEATDWAFIDAQSL